MEKSKKINGIGTKMIYTQYEDIKDDIYYDYEGYHGDDDYRFSGTGKIEIGGRHFINFLIYIRDKIDIFVEFKKYTKEDFLKLIPDECSDNEILDKYWEERYLDWYDDNFTDIDEYTGISKDFDISSYDFYGLVGETTVNNIYFEEDDVYNYLINFNKTLKQEEQNENS